MHSYHIPVMGIGFTIDTPLKVAHYGIDSVISLVDDILLERLRGMYCSRFDLPYEEISESADDPRAKRITSYLNLINDLVDKKFEELKNTLSGSAAEVRKYFNMLPDSSTIKKEFKEHLSKTGIENFGGWIKDNLRKGSIDVNIMTKLDKDNYNGKDQLPVTYNDAHAALRGFAESKLNSSLVLSAGMNPRLYSYLEKFEDFYPDVNGNFIKKIILKVSDYRSALIQGKYLAKKGLWVSEYRIESGLNCGGHAFATDGYLLGPILAEFRDKRSELQDIMNEIFRKGLSDKNLTVPESGLSFKVSAQGGVGTADEHQFLLDHYEVDSVGWGTPFLLVPEATSVDSITLEQLAAAKEEDLYLSNISPLGVPFNSLKGNSKDIEKLSRVMKGTPGSACPKEYLINNNEFTENSICTASRQYQFLRIKELEKEQLEPEEHQAKFDKIVDKSCLCVGLGTSVLLTNEMSTKKEGTGVSICPGPNLAYFSKVISLEEMTNHIYGRTNVITRTDRPHMFIKELKMYIDYIRNKITEAGASLSDKQAKYLLTFTANLNEGINYYRNLFNDYFGNTLSAELENCKSYLDDVRVEMEGMRKG